MKAPAVWVGKGQRAILEKGRISWAAVILGNVNQRLYCVTQQGMCGSNF